MEEEFIVPAEVTAISGLSVGALAQLRHMKMGPKYYKPTAKIILYKRSDVIEWVEASAHVDGRPVLA